MKTRTRNIGRATRVFGIASAILLLTMPPGVLARTKAGRRDDATRKANASAAVIAGHGPKLRANPVAKAGANGALKPAAPSAPPVKKVAEPAVARRDPFRPLLEKREGGSGLPVTLPPGKAGLQVATMTVQGALKTPDGMVAIVSNPQGHVYFLRPGDKVYDGQVREITMSAVTFEQTARDAFGHTAEKTVMKPLSTGGGESHE